MTEFLSLDPLHKHLRKVFQHVSQWKGKLLVVKYGGAAMVNESLKQSFANDIVFLRRSGVNVVVVHGGGKDITVMADKLGIPTKFINGQRYTDKAMMDVVQMVLAGKTNKDIVSDINRLSGNAIGLSGIDASLLRAKKFNDGKEDLGLVGEITSVNSEFIHQLLHNGLLPVIAPIGVDDEGTVYNINADVAAAAIAREIQADALLFLSDVPGISINDSLLQQLTYEDASRYMHEGSISGGMIPKIESGFNALDNGVDAVHFIDGREEHSILRQLCSSISIGTGLSLSPERLMKLASA